MRQVTEGHEYVQSLFGKRPRIAWQIDPFGHSSATPALFARMGYEAMVINRIHFDAKSKLKGARSMEFVWRAPEHAGGPSPSQDHAGGLDMFTHVLHTHYSAPKGFDFENPGAQGVRAAAGARSHARAAPSPPVRRGPGVPMISDHNVESRAARFANEMRGRAAAYRTSHLLVPFGDDFKFKQAKRQFSNMDRLIRHINSNPHYNLRIRYSTLSDYFDSATAEARDRRVQFPAFTGDYFPYADNRDSYWSGYYSTRPAIKEASRGSEAWLRGGELALALARALPAPPAASDPADRGQGPDWPAAHRSLENARLESALLLHHDAVTGTARQRVYRDYLERTQRAREGLEPHVGRAISRLLARSRARPVRSRGDAAADDAAFHQALEAAAARARLPPSELRVTDWLRPAAGADPGMRLRRLMGAGGVRGAAPRAASDVALEMARGGVGSQPPPPPVAVGATTLAQARDPRFQQPVAVHNTLAWHRSEVVCLPVDGALPHTRDRFATVHDAAGTPLPAQLVRRVASRADLSPSGTHFGTEAELCWVAPLRPLAVETFFVHIPSAAFSREERVPAAQQAAAPVTHVYRVENGVSRPVHSPGMRGAGTGGEGVSAEESLHDDVTLSNDVVEAVVDRSTGLLTSIRHKATGTRVHVGQDLAHYTTTRSGAYLFRPRGDPDSLAAKDAPLLLAVSHGPVVSAVHAQWDSFELVRLRAQCTPGRPRSPPARRGRARRSAGRAPPCWGQPRGAVLPGPRGQQQGGGHPLCHLRTRGRQNVDGQRAVARDAAPQGRGAHVGQLLPAALCRRPVQERPPGIVLRRRGGGRRSGPPHHFLPVPRRRPRSRRGPRLRGRSHAASQPRSGAGPPPSRFAFPPLMARPHVPWPAPLASLACFGAG